jgi:hypothetical protein
LKKLSDQLIINGLIYTIIIFLWPVFMVLSQVNGTVEEQLQQIVANPALYKLGFVFASLIAPSIIIVMFTYIKTSTGLVSKNQKTIGIIFLGIYSVLITISYVSQYTIVFRYINSELPEKATFWCFQNNKSIAYYLNQFGYAAWGVGALMLFYKYIFLRGTKRLMGIFMTAAAVLSLIALFGLIIQNSSINSMTIVSGFLIVPAGIIAMLEGFKYKKERL